MCTCLTSRVESLYEFLMCFFFTDTDSCLLQALYPVLGVSTVEKTSPRTGLSLLAQAGAKNKDLGILCALNIGVKNSEWTIWEQPFQN